MKPKRHKSVLDRARSLGKGGTAAVVTAFQQIPFGLGTVVSIGIHGLAMPSVISWVQREEPRPPESVAVVTLDESELNRLPSSMRGEFSSQDSESSEDGGWDWFTSRSGSAAVTAPESGSLPPAARSENSLGRSPSRGGWKYNTADEDDGESQDQFMARLRSRLSRARQRQRQRQRLDINGGRSRNDGTNQTRTGGTGDDDDEKGEVNSNNDANGGKDRDADDKNEGNTQGDQKRDVPPELPPELSDRITTLKEAPISHDGRSLEERETRFTKVLYSDLFDDWIETVSSNGGLKDEKGKTPPEVDNKFWLDYEPEAPLIMPFRQGLLCALSPEPAPLRLAMLGGPDGKFDPEESPRIVTSSGYEKLDGEALEWMYKNFRETQLTPHQGYIIHLFTLAFPACEASAPTSPSPDPSSSPSSPASPDPGSTPAE